MNEKTTKQQLESLLEGRASVSPSTMANHVSTKERRYRATEMLDFVHAIRKSTNGQLYGAPAECKDCGYDNFKDIIKIPSTCPECKSTWIEEPRFTIETETVK